MEEAWWWRHGFVIVYINVVLHCALLMFIINPIGFRYRVIVIACCFRINWKVTLFQRRGSSTWLCSASDPVNLLQKPIYRTLIITNKQCDCLQISDILKGTLCYLQKLRKHFPVPTSNFACPNIKFKNTSDSKHSSRSVFVYYTSLKKVILIQNC